MLLVTYSALLMSALSVVRSACPGSPWRLWRGHCYRLSERAVVWHGIRAECKSPFRQADVAIITSKRENDFIRAKFASRRNVWLGMRSHGDRRWRVDGKPVNYTNFATSSRKASSSHGAGDAVQMNKISGTWKLVSSYAPPIKLHGVCKMASCSCPSDWKTWGKRCHKVVARKFGWVEARKHCTRMAPTADLASIRNAGENNFVSSLAGGLAWIGLNDREQEGLYRWSDQRKPTYTNWRRGEPNPTGKRHRKDCIAMSKDKAWGVFSCKTISAAKKFVCQKAICSEDKVISTEQTRVGSVRVWRTENGLHCPTGWSRSGNKCFSRPTAAATFSKAQRQCEKPARLAVINSLTDNDLAFLVADTLPVWISHGNKFTYWQHDSPGKRGCVSLQKSGKWLSVPCDKTQPALCQVSACTPWCPFFWSKFQGRCYRCEDMKRNAKDAEAECRKLGGHLASIQSQDENDFIQTMVFRYSSKYRLTRVRSERFVWIGASRPNKNSAWSWSDGTDWTMSRWADIDGNLTSKDTCATMSLDGRWKGSTNCKEERFRFVCKIDPCRKQFRSLEESEKRRDRTATQAQTIIAKPATTKQSDGCPADRRQWSRQGDICLTASKSNPVRFSKASKTCKVGKKAKFKVSLPIIRMDSRKDALLKLAAGSNVWLGLERRASSWRWHDGTPAGTLNWQVKPNNVRKRCAAMDGKTGGLVARRCSDRLPFFCQAKRK